MLAPRQWEDVDDRERLLKAVPLRSPSSRTYLQADIGIVKRADAYRQTLTRSIMTDAYESILAWSSMTSGRSTEEMLRGWPT